MTALELACSFMEIFFSGHDLDRLHGILADDLEFDGPFYQFVSRQDYVASLLADPPVDCRYRVLHEFVDGDKVNLIYEFTKPGVTSLMSQLFEIQDAKISRITLIFDSASFNG